MEWGEIQDPSLARDLLRAGVPLERVSALVVYPAVHAAWADGSVRVLETLALCVAAIRAELGPAEFELVLGWTTAQPKNSEQLLDLAWRLYESVPALQQRLAPDLAWSSARMVARCSGGILRLFSIRETERLALETLASYASGAGLETARRLALSWESSLERDGAVLSFVRPEQVEAEVPGPGSAALSHTLRSALLATQSAPQIRVTSVAHHLQGDERRRFLRAIKRDRDRDLLPTLREAFTSLSDSERALIDAPPSLAELQPWQACRLALLIVCRAARAPDETFDADDLIAAQAEGNQDYIARFLNHDVQALIEHDRALTPALLRTLVDGEAVGFVCRHYVRMVCALYRALRHTATGLKDTFLIPLYGVHDARVRQAHAWCLFVDAPRGVACPLDPTAADAWWDAGRAESFLNPLLPALDYANLSALVVRFLLVSQSAGVEAACELVAGLPPARRPQLAIRLLVQWPLLRVVSDEDFAVLVERAANFGAPEEFLARARELRGGEPDTLSPQEERTARVRLGQFLVAAEFATPADLPASLRS